MSAMKTHLKGWMESVVWFLHQVVPETLGHREPSGCVSTQQKPTALLKFCPKPSLVLPAFFLVSSSLGFSFCLLRALGRYLEGT